MDDSIDNSGSIWIHTVENDPIADDGQYIRASPVQHQMVNAHIPILNKPIPQHLPHLSIPSQRIRSSFPLPSETPETETPPSLGSPIVGVVDLTAFVKNIDSSPVTHGGLSDIYQGELERKSMDEDGRETSSIVPIAVKLIRVLSAKDHDGVKARKRLNREVYVWHRLDHPNVAAFFGTSYHLGGRPAMIMQWYPNGSATEYLRHKNPAADRMALILDVAQGLKYLHTLEPRIVHGDLKANNVLIANDGHAVLSDFGLSQVLEELVGPTGWTLTNPDSGPLRWQAPELLMDDSCPLNAAADVWSFGCTAYELLSGNIPYQNRIRDYLVLQDIQRGLKPVAPDDPALLNAGPGISVIIDACWTFNPSERIEMTQVEQKIHDILTIA
ncbi:kinase-like domain-containing protein [Mycena floridula]|nr:kinase-like domain-containing protein [Mycena floridula]